MPQGCRPAGAEIACRDPQIRSVLSFVAAPLATLALAWPAPARAMHLADGILPLGWAALWTAAALPFVALALWRYRARAERDPQAKALAAMVAVVVFLLSCMPIPIPVVGSCSHPCGTGLAAILIGPWMAVLITVAALILQALFLAHGGITTLGADVLSMGVAGAFAGWAAFELLRRVSIPLWFAAFAAGVAADWCTYAVTSLELASALHGARPFGQLFFATCVAFAPTQVPLGVLEGALTAGAVAFMVRRRPDLVARLGLAGPGGAP